MAKILNHPRVYSFLHVPVQAASDSVLMDMRREYCQADFRMVADFLKERYLISCTLSFHIISPNICLIDIFILYLFFNAYVEFYNLMSN